MMPDTPMKISIGNSIMIGEIVYIVTQVRVDTFLRGSSVMILANDELDLARLRLEDQRRKELIEKQATLIDKTLEI